MNNKICKVKDCNNKVLAKSFCRKHYLRLYKNGTLELLNKPNKYYLTKKYVYICIYSKKHNTHVTFVNREDYDLIKNYNWCLQKIKNIFYAFTNLQIENKRTTKTIHQILNPTWKETDHIDGNGLNNTRSNLRKCSHQQNTMNKRKQNNNTSGWKGVYFRKDRNKYVAQAKKDGIKYHLGHFDAPIDAARTYDRKAIELFGEFANLNFPKENYI